MAGLDIKSVGVFIDGGYYAKIDEGLAQTSGMKVNLKGLLGFILERICKMDGIRSDKISITEGHYYRGRFRAKEADDKQLLLEERKFEDMLIENDIICHYKHLREKKQGNKVVGVIEKGIDTWFALDTYEMTLNRKFDYTVLISGDADHEMLARKLRALKTHVILLTWDPSHSGSTSPFLSEEVFTHFDMNTFMSQDQTLLKRLCVKTDK